MQRTRSGAEKTSNGIHASRFKVPSLALGFLTLPSHTRWPIGILLRPAGCLATDYHSLSLPRPPLAPQTRTFFPSHRRRLVFHSRPQTWHSGMRLQRLRVNHTVVFPAPRRRWKSCVSPCGIEERCVHKLCVGGRSRVCGILSGL